MGGRATGDGDCAVWVLCHKRSARGYVHVSSNGRWNDAGLGNCADPAGICGPAGSQQVRPAGAYISHFQQPSLPKIALDIKVPLLRIRWTETPNAEEEEARKRPSACAPENGRARRSVKANECGHHLITRKWKRVIWQDPRERRL